nr:ATP synthase F0 subunit b [Bostrychia moritziana]
MNLLIIIVISLSISSKILLLNEELLILICFIFFCWIGIEKFSFSINSFFENKNYSDKTKLINSFTTTTLKLNQQIKFNKTINKTKSLFIYLKQHYLSSSSKYLTNFTLFIQNKKNLLLQNQLNLLLNLEKSYEKQIFFVLFDKLKSNIQILNFYQKKYKISKFQSQNKLILREYIKQI